MKMTVLECVRRNRKGGKDSTYERGDMTEGGWSCVYVEGPESYWAKLPEEKSVEPKKNFIPTSMSCFAGFLGLRNKDAPLKIFDKVKATKIINELLSQGKKIEEAIVGLDGDWKCNSDKLYSEGKFCVPDLYEVSSWATPGMLVTFDDHPSLFYEVWYCEECDV